MESRIAKIEQDLAVMSVSLTSIAKTMDRLSELYTDTRLITERLATMDKELIESFKRYDARITKMEATFHKLMWLVITPIIIGLIGTYVKGGN